MLAADVAWKALGGILRKNENCFSILAFFWSLYVVIRKTSTDRWEDKVISVCDVIRCVSIPLFHSQPSHWTFVFGTCSVFSLIVQKKHLIGLAVLGSLHIVLYFLLLGLSPITYWNFGKQFFNLVVWPDDPRQLAIEMGMSLAVCLMSLHCSMDLASRVLSVVGIDWFSIVLLLHPGLSFHLFPSQPFLSVLAVWFSLFLLAIKYRKGHFANILGIVFLYIYMKTLSP